MRLLIPALVLAFAACSPPAAPARPQESVTAQTSSAPRSETSALAISTEAVAGQWSFDRSCGLYDLVFDADGGVDYYDYADHSHVLSYVGRWAIEDHNRIVLTVRLRGPDAAPTGDARTYALEVSEPIADDLVGRFGEAGAEGVAISARRCPDEDRD